MDETKRSDVVRSLEALLTIAKVAMPAYLFDLDPRVNSARRLLDELRDSAGLEQPVPIWDITEGIDRFMASKEAPHSRSEAVSQMVREWLTSNGYLILPPEEAN